MRQGHGHAFRRGETVLAIENHAMATIEQHDRGARTVILALVHHQNRVGNIDRDLRAIAPHGIEQGLADIHVQGVAKFVLAGNAAGLDSRGQVPSGVAAKTAAPKRTEQILQSLEAEKIDGLVGNLEARFGVAPLRLPDLPAGAGLRRRSYLRRLLRINVAFLGHALH